MPRILEDPVLSAELRVLPRPGVYYVGLNTLRAPTDDVNVRKALAASIDRQTIVENVLNTPWRTIAVLHHAAQDPGLPGIWHLWPCVRS